MNIGISTTMGEELARYLDLSAAQTKLTAANMANLDTPGYRPVDLDRATAGDPASLAVTHAGHIGSTQTTDSVKTFDDGGQLQGADGNAVSLERELAKIDANRTRYAANSELVSRQFALLRYAAGDGT